MNQRKYTKSRTLDYALCVSDSTVMDALHLMYPYIIGHKYQPEDFEALVAKYKAQGGQGND